MTRILTWTVRGAAMSTAAAGLAMAISCRGDTPNEAATHVGTGSRVDQPVNGEPSQRAVTLDENSRRRAGLETKTLAATNELGQLQLAGELISDPGHVATVEAPVAGRLVVAPGGHWPTFGERVAEGTILGQVSDAKPLEVGRSGTVTRLTAQPGQLVQAGQELLELTDFSEPLVRVVWRPDAPLPAPLTIRIAPLLGTGAPRSGQPAPVTVTAHLVGPASAVDSLTRLPVYLYRAAHEWLGAGPGTPVQATISAFGAVTRGLFVPAAAVVQWQGLAWAYVERPAPAKAGIDEADGPVGEREARFSYVRKPVDTSHPVQGGWLLTGQRGRGDLGAGDAVVVRGAQQLLSEEFRNEATPRDEDEK